MIDVLEFKQGPLVAGERRRLVLAGDGPFTVSTSCFVDNPPPPGFRPCQECPSTTVVEREVFTIQAGAKFWKGKTGLIDVAIKDSVGDSLRLQLQVLPDTAAAPRGGMMTA